MRGTSPIANLLDKIALQVGKLFWPVGLGLMIALVSGCGHKPESPHAPAAKAIAPKPTLPEIPISSSPVEIKDASPSDAVSAKVKSPPVQKIYRPDDTRPVQDDERAAEFGIRKYVSDRLILYTDIDPEQAQRLPPIIDQVYAAWVQYFGELPPNRTGTPWQMTGYLIGDTRNFVAAGMLPEGPPMFRFGRHEGAQFWMNDQSSDYYRQHLLIHEATHCFMTFMLRQYPTRWYLEGMAEEFGTHVLKPDGTALFGVMPQVSEAFPGLGRIELIQQELVLGRPVSLSQLGTITAEEWAEPRPAPYAWGWALCHFLDQHPRYQKRFHELGQHLERQDFERFLKEHFEQDRALLAAEWSQYIRRLCYGYDVAANAFVVNSGDLKSLDQTVSLDASARQGWQSSGLRVTAGIPIRIEATGEVVLNTVPKPWLSQPQGISIQYAAGEPIGRLLASILPDAGADPSSSSFEVISVGQDKSFTPLQSGELWLRVNDLGSDLGNNTGAYQVTIRREESLE